MIHILLRQKGMTLIELMIAIGIAAVLSVLASQFLTGIIASEERTDEVTRNISRLQKAMLFLERDLYQIVNREIRTGQGETEKYLTFDEQYLLEFTRTGWRNPREQLRSRMQRVAYQLVPMSEETCETLLTPEQIELGETPEGFCFVRYYWPVLDRLDDDGSIKTQPMLGEVASVQISFFVRGNGAGSWVNQLPSNKSSSVVAFKFVFEMSRLGTIERVFTVPATGEWGASS